MENKAAKRSYFEFGEYRLDLAEHRLLQNDLPVSLPPKAFDLLAVLIEKSGHLITKDELMRAVWKDAFVEESNLSLNIHMLRKIFGEQKFIETVPRLGYRFTEPVREIKTEALVFEKTTHSQIVFEEEIETDATAETKMLLPAPRRHRFFSLAIAAGVLLIIGAVAFFTFTRRQPEPTHVLGKSPIHSLAVLPLKNLSKTEADEPLSVGLTDALITKLGNIRGLAVRPTRASMVFAESSETPQSIGEKLNVEAILDSQLQHEGGRVRVFVQLIRTADAAILWSENFDETEADLFKFQDLISSRVAEAFRLKNPDRQTASHRTEDFEAYKLYLRGRHAWNKRTPEGLRQSIQFFKQSIDRDPTFALAFAGLADSYALLSEYNLAPPRDSFPQAKAAAQRALEIDENLAEAHTTLAYALANYDWNFEGAEHEYLRAIELNPNHATAHQWYAEFLSAMRRFDEAKVEIKRAEQLDPLSPIIQSIVGLIFYHARDFDAAIAQYQKTINNHPNFPVVYAYLSLAYAQKGMYDEAFEAEAKLLQAAAGADEKSIEVLRQIYRQNGWKGFLRALLAGTNTEAQKHYMNAFSQAFLYMRMGEREQSLEWLEKSFAEQHRYVVYLNADPYADFLRDDPRFQNLIRRVGLKN
jgi:DNA-binding winged helix-turn-helix (wHTH) protein/TolB-like protein/Tfp pilus assembly protein PilF